MASIINASTTSTSGLVQTADASGVLQLQSNGVTGLTVGSGGLLTAANGMVFSSMTLGTATAGKLEYDGRVPYFTPLGTQRGVIPGMQYYRLDSTLAGANATGAQNMLGVGVTLSSSTIYAFDALLMMSKSAGTTSHTVAFGFGGTFTNNNIVYSIVRDGNSTGFTNNGNTAMMTIQTANSTVITGARTAAAFFDVLYLKGTVSVNSGGTFIPQYTLSAAPGGAYTTAVGSYFLIYPIGAAGSNINIGTWA